jgi:hypothetical protein
MQLRLSFIKIEPHGFGVFTFAVIKLEVFYSLRDYTANLSSCKGHIGVGNFGKGCWRDVLKLVLFDLSIKAKCFLVKVEVK